MTAVIVNGTAAAKDFTKDFTIEVLPEPAVVSGPVIGYNVSTFAGSTMGYRNGLGAAAQFDCPIGIAVDKDGTVYVADTWNHVIRKIARNGLVMTLAGGNGEFYSPHGVAIGSDGTVYIADSGNHRICKIAEDGTITTLAGSTQGYRDGLGAEAQFNSPFGIGVDSTGTVYVADSNNYVIRKITGDGQVTTLAGNGAAGFADGTGTAAQFSFLTNIAVDGTGTVYAADYYYHHIRKITAAGVVTTLMGDAPGIGSDPGGVGNPYGVAVDTDGTLYVADALNRRVHQIAVDGVVTTLAGSTQGAADGQGAVAQFHTPRGIAVDSDGTLYVADAGVNNRIRKLAPLYESETLGNPLGGGSTFIAVTEITGVTGSISVGPPITLTGTVVPGDATHETIVWSLQNAGETGAVISGDMLCVTAAGTATVRATIANGAGEAAAYTQDFEIAADTNSVTTYMAMGGSMSWIASGSDWDEVHVFTTTGDTNFAVTRAPPDGTVKMLLVAGGGGGGMAQSGKYGGGGGAGGLVMRSDATLDTGEYMVTVGAGGSRGDISSQFPYDSAKEAVEWKSNGQDSTIASGSVNIASATGGGGGGWNFPGNFSPGGDGGSGGAGRSGGGRGVTGQGKDGAEFLNDTTGGGGGYTSEGQEGDGPDTALGGTGLAQENIPAAMDVPRIPPQFAKGGAGGSMVPGPDNTGNGGGGGVGDKGERGGSGIVIIRFPWTEP